MIAVLALILVLALVWSRPHDDTASRARIAQLEGQLRAAQQQVAQAKAAADKSAQLVNTRRASVAVRDTALREGLQTAERVAIDSASTPDTLRLTLINTTQLAEQYREEVLRYQASVDTLLIAHVRERQHMERQINVMQDVIDAQAAALAPCTRFGVRCLTRTQSFVFGFAIALTVVVLL